MATADHLNMALLLLHAGAEGEYTLDGKSCAEIADAKGALEALVKLCASGATAQAKERDAATPDGSFAGSFSFDGSTGSGRSLSTYWRRWPDLARWTKPGSGT